MQSKTDRMDFTLAKYDELLDSLTGFSAELRHDVDKAPGRSLEMARLEASKGWKSTYYFRAVPCSWDEGIIREIASLGHEIGYHYECLTTAGGDIEAAWEDFRANFSKLKELYPSLHRIVMHGSPRSPFDSRDLWKHYDYHEAGADYEPYLDTDFSNTFYLTDTGRRWDGFNVSVRDKIPQWQDAWSAAGLVYHSTDQVIAAARAGTLPSRLMITTHPQRWMPFGPGWVRELLTQSVKNCVKKLKLLRICQ